MRDSIPLIKPLTVGAKTYPINIIQGPLAGVSCAPFRVLTWRYGKPAFSCTEMLSSKTLINKSLLAQKRFVKIDPEEGDVCFQLAANNPLELAEATKRVTAYGANLIDLNCGCPVKKIRSKGAGSGLLKDPQKLYHMIVAMKQNTHVPVSVKIRVEGGSNDTFNAEVAKVVSEAGADFLVVHGRHWTEHYDVACHYEDIEFFVQHMKIPVIGNGDIACVDSLKKMLATGCAGVMISRAGVGQPWLIQKLLTEARGEVFIMPSHAEISAIFLEHVRALAELLGSEKFAILQARKFGKYYAKCLPDRMVFATAINQCETLAALENICLQYFT